MKTNLAKLCDLVTEVVEREGCERPPIRWHFRGNTYSTGVTYHDRKRGIALTVGTDHHNARLVTLHELAHWLTPEERGHGRVFWETALRLYREAGIGWATIHRIECRLFKTAHQVHKELAS